MARRFLYSIFRSRSRVGQATSERRASPPPEPLYHDLDETKAEIRVLELHSGKEEERIRCTLHTVSLNDGPQYDALSYVWGDGNKTITIIVNGQPFQATVNLEAFLRALRKGHTSTVLWADAICIDQSNLDERASQVRQMGAIYKKSSFTRAWLGEFTEGWSEETPAEWQRFDHTIYPPGGISPSTFDTVGVSFQEASNVASSAAASTDFSEMDGTVHDAARLARILGSSNHWYEMPFYAFEGDAKQWRKFHMPSQWYTSVGIFAWVLGRPWWTRTWTIQEALLPSNEPILHAGHEQLSAKPFIELRRMFVRHAFCCARFLGFLCGADAPLWDLIEQAGYLGQMAEQPGINLCTALSASLSRHATNPRDFLYGILGLLPSYMPNIKVDYTSSVQSVACQATRMVIDRYWGAWPWPTHIVGVNDPDLPSWVIPLTHNIVLHSVVLFHGDAHAGDPQRHEKAVAFGPSNNTASPVLHFKATKISAIQRLAPPQMPPSQDWWELDDNMIMVISQWLDTFAGSDSDLTAREFWTAILQEHIPSNPNFHHRTDSLEATSFMQNTTSSVDAVIEWWQTYRNKDYPTDDEFNADPAAAVERLKLRSDNAYSMFLLKPCMELAFFATMENRFGLCRPSSQTGDEIYVPLGGKYPLILRRQQPRAESAAPAFTMVGPCHLNGVMQGQAVRDDTIWEDIEVI